MHYFCQNYAILYPQIGLLFITFRMDYQRLVHAAQASLALSLGAITGTKSAFFSALV